MVGTIAKRILMAIPSIAGVIVVTFLLTRVLPGDTAAYFAGPAATAEAIAEVRHKLGLDQSLPVQFVNYVGALARGDMGTSLSTGRAVTTEIRERLPASAELTILALVLSILIAGPLGIFAAMREGSWIDHLCRLLATAGVSVPVFFSGLLLVYVFYYRLGWAPAPLGRLDVFATVPDPVTGFYLIDSLIARDMDALGSAAAQLVLPTLTLAVFAIAPIARITRAAMLESLASDYVRTAQAAGLSKSLTILTYALPNALLPIVTTMGMVFSFLLGANVLVEKVFAWPGVGSYAVDALVVSDYAPVQGFVLTMAVLYVLINLLIDLTYVVIDPRIRIEA